MMIDRALILKNALHIVASSDENLKKYLLSKNEWKYIDEVHKFLQVCILLINFFYINILY